MNYGKTDYPAGEHVLAALRGNGNFSLPEAQGAFDKNSFAQCYADVIEGRLIALDFEGIEIEAEGSALRITASNPDGSSFDLGFSVNDRMGIDADYLHGISVAHGNEVPLDWKFGGDITAASLDEFLSYFKEW